MKNSTRRRPRGCGRFAESAKILFGILLLTAFVPHANAQLTGYAYKDAISIQENSNTQKVNYQVLLVLNTQTLISAGQMNAAGNDIRFAKDCAGATLYPYFIESGINTANTLIWVMIDTIPAGGTRVVNMFYGNATAAAASSFDGAFPPATRLQVPAGNVTLTGTNNYSWFEVSAGATVTATPNAPLVINARKIKVNGTIDANGAGYLGGPNATNGSGPGYGHVSSGNSGTFGGGGASYGGLGGVGGGPSSTTYSLCGQPGIVYGTTSTDSINMGSGGGGAATPGGAGGGAVTLNGDVVEIMGMIKADGAAGTQTVLNGGGGGGSGGGVRVKGDWLTIAGTITANGGTGGGGAYSGGGGGGGRIKIFSDSYISNTGGQIVSAGNPGSQNSSGIIPGLAGNPGEVYVGTYTSGVPTYSMLPHVSLVAAPNPSCSNIPVVLTATPGFSNYIFEANVIDTLSDSPNNAYSTPYLMSGDMVRVLASYSNGCYDTSNTIAIVINPAPTPDLGPDTMICTTASVTLSPGTYSNYLWQDNSMGSTYVADGSVLGTGTHTIYVGVMDANGCVGADTVVVQVSICTGVDAAEQLDFSVVPNPSGGNITIVHPGTSGELQIEILNLQGEILQSVNTNAGSETQLDLSGLAQGIYYIRLIDGEQTSVKKIVVQH
jgi:hypothetical protein